MSNKPCCAQEGPLQKHFDSGDHEMAKEAAKKDGRDPAMAKTLPPLFSPPAAFVPRRSTLGDA